MASIAPPGLSAQVVHRTRRHALPLLATIVRKVLLTVQGFLALLGTSASGARLTRLLAPPRPEHFVPAAPRRRPAGGHHVLLDLIVWAITFFPSLAVGRRERTAQLDRILPPVPAVLLGSIAPGVPPTNSPVRQDLEVFAQTELAIQVEFHAQLATSVLVALPVLSHAMRRLANIVPEERLTTMV